MNSTVLSVIIASAVFTAGAAPLLINNNWQSVDDVYDGSLTNEAHWSLSKAPSSLEKMTIGPIDADFTVEFPEGSYTNSANFVLSAFDGRSVTVDGSNSTWVMPGSQDGETEVYGDNPFAVNYGAYSSLIDLSLKYSKLYTKPVAEFTNFKFTASGSMSNLKLVFDGGSYNFRDPSHYEWSMPTNPVLFLCKGNGNGPDFLDLEFRRGVSLRAWDVGIQAAGKNGGRVIFDGGEYYVEGLNFPCGYENYANNIASESITILTNGAVVSAASASVGSRPNKIVRLDITGEGTRFETRTGEFIAANGGGITYLNVLNGATLHMGNGGKFLFTTGTNITKFVDAKVSADADITIGEVNSQSRANASRSIVAITNSTFSVVGALTLNHVGKVFVGSNSKCNIGSLFVGGKASYTGCLPTLTLDDSLMVITNDSSVGQFGNAQFVLNSGSLTCGAHFRIGQNSNSCGTMTINGGVFSNDFANGESFATKPTVTYLASSHETSKGILNINGGKVYFNSLYAGFKGAGEVNVSGGLLSLRNEFRLGCSKNVHTLTQTGGEIYSPTDQKSFGFSGDGCDVRIALNGGRFITKSINKYINKSINGGTVAEINVGLSADGGTLKAISDSPTFIKGFDSAILSGKGLTVDTAGYNITICQDFSGSGSLNIDGGGTVSFAQGTKLSCPLNIADETSIIFNDEAIGGSLTLGDGAVLKNIDSQSAVVVNGDITVGKNLTLSFASAPVIGQVLDVFYVSGNVSDDSIARWAEILVSNAPEDAAYESSVCDEDGKKVFRITFRESKVINWSLPPEVSQTHTTNIFVSVNDAINVSVGEGASLRLEGILFRGGFVKDGLGSLTLANQSSFLYNGLFFRLGTLNLDYPSPGAMGNWSLTFDAANMDDNLFLTSTKDVAISNFTSGKGSLNVVTPASICLNIAGKTDISGYLNIQQGELKFKGPGNTVPQVSFSRNTSNAADYGMTMGQNEVDSVVSTKVGLVVDGIHLVTPNPIIANDILPSSHLEEVYIVVTNNGVLNANGTFLFRSKAEDYESNLKASILLDSGILQGNMTYNHYAKTKVPPKLEAKNGSELRGRVAFRSCFDMLYDNSTLNGPLQGPSEISYYANWDYTNNIKFVNGSVANISVIKSGTSTTKYATPANINLIFDNSEFKGMANGDFGHADPGLSANPNVKVLTAGIGPIVNVPQGSTYSWSYPLADLDENKGGFVKRGEGTLRVGRVRNPDMEPGESFSFAHTGPTIVEDGVLDLDGQVWPRATIGGGEGVVANGTLHNARIAIELEEGSAKKLPNFASNCSFTGRTKINLSGGTLPLDATIDVASYEGTAPNVDVWRLTGNGDTAGSFIASNGKVIMRVVPKGRMTLILR